VRPGERRLDWLVREERQTVNPVDIASDSAFHYSIPALDELGDGQYEPVSEIGSAKLLLSGGEVLISKLNPRLPRVMVAEAHEKPTVASTEFIALRPGKDIDHRFLVYWLTSDSVRQLLESATLSVTRSQQRVRPEILTKSWVAIPSLEEQRVIADFLNIETARIDALISKKRQLQGRLTERLRAMVEGRLSASQDRCIALGRFVTSLTQGVSPQAGGRPAEFGERGLLKLSAVKNGEFDPSENKVLDVGMVENGLTATKGDLLVTRANTPEYVGDVCCVPADFPNLVICDLIYRVRLDKRLLPEFATLALMSSGSRGLLSSIARGTSQSMVKLRGEDIKNLRIPVPSLADQRRVVSEAHAARAAWSRISRQLRRQISLLVEHRQALITAAVTGELDILRAA
jgi:type I restriction enzyme, S subunit